MFTPTAILTGGIQGEPTPVGPRYWRYYVDTAVVDHHPRVARIDLIDEFAITYNLVTYVGDNCSDSGTIPGTNASAGTYDFGVLGKNITNAQFYVSYGGDRRAANIILQSSENNTDWTNEVTGVADSDANPASPRCGLHTIV